MKRDIQCRYFTIDFSLFGIDVDNRAAQLASFALCESTEISSYFRKNELNIIAIQDLIISIEKNCAITRNTETKK
jgi:hypothetical protein